LKFEKIISKAYFTKGLMSNHINILGVNISVVNKNEVLSKIEQYLKGGKRHFIVTPNPEFILTARRDEEFFYILNKADLAIPDGIGLKFAAWVMGKNIYRYPGADMVKDILRIAQDRGLKIAVLNWRGGLSGADDIRKVLTKKYPDLQFMVENVDRDAHVEMQNFASLWKFQPEILFVTLGSPWQEKFIYHKLPTMPFTMLAIGVGGSFDFLTGKIKRAPKFLRILGLEWLWRLLKQPWRWQRIYKAVIVFPCEFFKWRFINRFFYRKNVVCLLYKKENSKYKILLVKRVYQQEHWQLPQGGTDNQCIKAAGISDLSEEINCSQFKPMTTFKNLWKYDFDDKLSKFGPKAQLVWGYRGQKQGLFLAQFLGQDKDIKINFWEHSNWKWVDSANLVNEVHLIRKKATKIFLEKFNQVIEKYEAENKKIYLSY
jgi:N-acetylglucosaminyldiphosphoundecaprenol N-acetyl-beta-D-mannosaminyltransferase